MPTARRMCLAELLADQGITLSWKTAMQTFRLWMYASRGDTVMLATVLEGGAGHKGGLVAGDVLAALTGCAWKHRQA